MNDLAIIIPGYNCEKDIYKCLKSILKQSKLNYTVFFIDDGSTDSTKNIVKSFNNEHIKYIYQKNSGVSVARNNGLYYAREFEYIMFADSDDWFEDGAFDIIQKTIDCSNKADYILFDWNEYYFENNIKKRKTCKMNERFSYETKIEDIKTHLLRSRSGGSPWAKLFKNEIIRENNIKFIKELPYAEDYLFNLFFLKNANTFYYNPIPLYAYNCFEVGARGKFRKNLVDILITIESEKKKLYIDEFEKYRVLLISELLEQTTVALRNLTNKEFSLEERKIEKRKIKAFLEKWDIHIKDILGVSINIKIKVYLFLFLFHII